MQKSKRFLIVLILILVVGTGALFSASLSPFWTIDMYGNEVDQTIFKNSKLTLVNVWATFCPPCLVEMPDLAELSEEYDIRDVQVVGIINDVYSPNQRVFERNLQTAASIIMQTGADYTHLIPSEDLYNLRLKDVQFVPETFFVDNTGKIVGKTVIGAKSKSEWKKIIDENLKLVN